MTVLVEIWLRWKGETEHRRQEGRTPLEGMPSVTNVVHIPVDGRLLRVKVTRAVKAAPGTGLAGTLYVDEE
jgi:hypothetical protein